MDITNSDKINKPEGGLWMSFYPQDTSRSLFCSLILRSSTSGVFNSDVYDYSMPSCRWHFLVDVAEGEQIDYEY